MEFHSIQKLIYIAMSLLFTYNAQNIPLGLSLSLIILKNKCPEENCLSIPSFVALAALAKCHYTGTKHGKGLRLSDRRRIRGMSFRPYLHYARQL